MGEPTIRDVAREADVSVASVSRALNNHANVHPQTRERVLAAADRLGYVPHAGARSLSMARTHAIGVVLPDLHGEFFSEIVRGMGAEATRQGLQLLLSSSHAEVDQAAEALRAMRGRVDGMVIMAPHLDIEHLLTRLPPNLPSVLINCGGDGGGHPAYRVDNVRAVETMVQHLIDTDRRNIALISGPTGNLDADERRAAFRVAMQERTRVEDPVIFDGDFTEEAGAAAARAVLNGDVTVDAVFAANDMMAIGCLNALREGGISVPGQIAVAGFDDIPVARYLSLTTMRVRIAEMGARAVQRLAMLISPGSDEAGIEWFEAELVERTTTGG